MKRLHSRHVLVQRPFVRRQFERIVERHGAGRAAQLAPVRIDRIGIQIIVGIHMEADGLLVHVAVALDRHRFALRAGQGGQKHGGQNRDNGNDHQQLDQSEGKKSDRSADFPVRSNSRMLHSS